MTVDYQKTPFPWFGGKAAAAPHVWAALGDVPHYVEPFMGSLAVLLRRPHLTNRPYYSETVNDLDGFLVNAWRAIQLHPDETAEWASWPVSEADLCARHLWLLRWKEERQLEHLMGDPEWCDPRAAGYWMWGQSSWIGSGWCSGTGPWVVGEGGRIEKRQKPGVSRQLPHLGDNGNGVNHAGLREQGVNRQLPRIGNDGQGVNRPQLREQGVSRQLPHLTGDGKGVNRSQLREPGVGDPEWHPMTMPELRNWFGFLSARLRHVRILNGDWKRAVTSGAALTLPVRQGHGPCGIFLDPPYSAEASRTEGLYTCEDMAISHAVREWCLSRGPDPRYRIVLAGYEGEHPGLAEADWREIEWFKAGFLKGGMGNAATHDDDGPTHQQGRERLWLSPHCLRPVDPAQGSLW